MRVEGRRGARLGVSTRAHRSMRPVDDTELQAPARAPRGRDSGLPERRHLRPDAAQHVRGDRRRARPRALARTHRIASFARYGERMQAARAAFARGALERPRADRADALDDRRRQPRARRTRLARGRRDRHDRRRAPGPRRAARRARPPLRRRRPARPGAGRRRPRRADRGAARRAHAARRRLARALGHGPDPAARPARARGAGARGAAARRRRAERRRDRDRPGRARRRPVHGVRPEVGLRPVGHRCAVGARGPRGAARRSGSPAT